MSTGVAQKRSKDGDIFSSGNESTANSRIVMTSNLRSHTVVASAVQSSFAHENTEIRESDKISTTTMVDLPPPPSLERPNAGWIVILFLPVCFGLGYYYGIRSRSDEEQNDSSSSGSSEADENNVEAGDHRGSVLTPRKPCGTAKDLGLLAWLPGDRATDLISGGEAPPAIEILDPGWTAAGIKEIFSTYGVPVLNWTDSALEDLARELGKCKARLFHKGETLFRVVDIVIVIMAHKEEGTVIQEMSHPPYRREFATIPERTPKGRMLNNESITDCAKRCLQEKLHAPDGVVRDLKLDVLSIKENVEKFDHMPGLRSVVRNYVVQVNVAMSNPEDLEKIGAPRGRLEIEGYRYAWMNIKEVTNLKKHMKSSKKMKKMQKVVLDNSVEPVLAWTESEVLKHLAQAEVSREDAELHWGMDLPMVVEQLVGGQLMLAKNTGDRRLILVEDLVTLYVRSKDDMVLVQARTDTGETKKALPSTKKLANESSWAASFRLSFLELGIMSPSFNITEVSNDPIRRYEDVESANGRLKREFIVQARLQEYVPPTVLRLDEEDEDSRRSSFES